MRRLEYRYTCIHCNAPVKKGQRQCHRCERVFTSQDVATMIANYRENYARNWQDIVYLVVFVGALIAIILFN